MGRKPILILSLCFCPVRDNIFIDNRNKNLPSPVGTKC